MGTKEQILDRLSFENFYRAELQDLKPTGNDNHQARCPFHAGCRHEPVDLDVIAEQALKELQAK